MTSNQFTNAGPYVNGSAYAQDSGRGGQLANGADMGLPDDSMERIRDLIIGDLRRIWEARLHTLETRLQTLEDKVDALRHETSSVRAEQLASLAHGIEEFGQHVRRMTRP